MLHTQKNYTSSVRAFVKDSEEWYGLEDTSHFVSDGKGGWEENSDNANGGLDVSWAFHKNPTIEEIEQHFISEVRLELECIEGDDDKDFAVIICREEYLSSELASIAGKASAEARKGKTDYSALANKRWNKAQ